MDASFISISREALYRLTEPFSAGDAATTITDESRLVVEQGEEAEMLVFELR